MLTSGTPIYPNGIAYSLFCFAPSSAALKNSSLVQHGFFVGLVTPTTGQQASMETVPILKYMTIGLKDETDDDVPSHQC